MRSIQNNDHVRLTCDLPEQSLHRGAEGVVTSQWCAPDVAYEVEFYPEFVSEPVRVLLTASQISADDRAAVSA